jgi:hypothetical protein
MTPLPHLRSFGRQSSHSRRSRIPSQESSDPTPPHLLHSENSFPGERSAILPWSFASARSPCGALETPMTECAVQATSFATGPLRKQHL